MTKLDACPISEGVCAIVLARTAAVGAGRPMARVRGRASVSDTYNMGDRMRRPIGDLVDMVTLRRAAERAYRQADIGSAGAAQVVEIHAPFTHGETMTYGPLGLCDPADGPELVLSGYGRWGSDTVLNPSGGAQAANPVGATALVRLAESAQQVIGRAGKHQVPGARVAVATGQGDANQFSSCTVLTAPSWLAVRPAPPTAPAEAGLSPRSGYPPSEC